MLIRTRFFWTETTLSYASIMGIQKDIGLKGDNYQWLGSMFYFGGYNDVDISRSRS